MGSRTSKSRQRVICIGDSLTWGFTCAFREAYPYGAILKSILEEDVGAGVLDVEIHGVNGEHTQEMEERLKGIVGTGAQHYEHTTVIIIGGTNDVGCHVKPEKSMRHVKAMHRLCHNKGFDTVMGTLPSSLVPDQWWKDARQVYNTMLRAQRASGGMGPPYGDGGDAAEESGVWLLDISDICEGREKAECGEDGLPLHDRLHPCAADYDEIARRAAAVVRAIWTSRALL